MFDSKAYVEKDLEFQEKLKKIYTQQLKGLPEGGLSKSGKYFFKHLNGVRIYLGAERTKEIFQLQKKKFLTVSLKKIEENIKVMRRLLMKYKTVEPNKVQESLGGAYKILPDDCFTLSGTRKSKEWGYQDYPNNDRYPAALVHRTMKGEMVRSKSEAMVANTMFLKDIPYHYEELVKIGGKTIAPDFRIYIAGERRFVLLEHIGMISDPEYFQKFLWKVELYIRNGYIPWRDIIFTFDDEKGHLDTRLLEKIIDGFCC